MRTATLLTTILLWFIYSAGAVAAEGFPGREKFPKVPYIELEDLNKTFNDVIVVDARSKLEFETLRIKGSVNIPVASKTFEEQVAKLRAGTDKPIVFYCNGHRCMKSYHAVQKAMAADIKKVFAYDAGDTVGHHLPGPSTMQSWNHTTPVPRRSTSSTAKRE